VISTSSKISTTSTKLRALGAMMTRKRVFWITLKNMTEIGIKQKNIREILNKIYDYYRNLCV
jgi:hypothetical protein